MACSASLQSSAAPAPSPTLRHPFTVISFGLFTLGEARATRMWPSSSMRPAQLQTRSDFDSHTQSQPAPQSHSQTQSQLQPHRIRASLKEERLSQQVKELSEELQLIKSQCTPTERRTNGWPTLLQPASPLAHSRAALLAGCALW